MWLTNPHRTAQAAQAGVRSHDVIISVNGKPAVSALETIDQVAEIRQG
ncbi:PDZ domain-containing protein [Shigella flexneri]